MKFPIPDDFLETFGMSPDCINEEDGFSQYSKNSANEITKLVLSFNVISESFQVCVYIMEQLALIVSSEKVSSLLIFRDPSEAGVRVEFDYSGLLAEAKVVLDPEPRMEWWVISK